jgi:hypothetical protein
LFFVLTDLKNFHHVVSGRANQSEIVSRIVNNGHLINYSAGICDFGRHDSDYNDEAFVCSIEFTDEKFKNLKFQRGRWQSHGKVTTAGQSESSVLLN